MYLPEEFYEQDADKIRTLIKDNPFALLMTAEQGKPQISHLPLEFEGTLDDEGKLRGKIVGHLSKNNPQYPLLKTQPEVLVLFQGPHAYISPSWYQTAGVPTWNYTSVQIRGQLKLIEDEAGIDKLVRKLTEHLESVHDPEVTDRISAEKRKLLLTMIAGFEIEIAQCEAIFKLSQNKTEDDRAGVIAHLSQSNNSTEQAIAELMKQL